MQHGVLVLVGTPRKSKDHPRRVPGVPAIDSDLREFVSFFDNSNRKPLIA